MWRDNGLFLGGGRGYTRAHFPDLFYSVTVPVHTFLYELGAEMSRLT